jgi:hypothetical protein
VRAIVHRDFGSAKAVRLEEIEKPVPADDEVLVADGHTRGKVIALHGADEVR